MLTGRVLVAGRGGGPLLRLEAPISFWGGVDAGTGRIIDPRHPQHGASVTAQVLALPRSIGSSSGSSILLELLARGRGPAAIVLGEADQILTLGAVVAREMGHAAMPVVLLEPPLLQRLPTPLHIDAEGRQGRSIALS